MQKQGTIFQGALLVAGTTIGGGMLALPVLTSLTGFFPSLVIYCLCWIFMAATGLLMLEVCLWMNGETNIVSMASRTLGRVGKGLAWCVYLFLFYCLTLAYIVGCGNLVVELFPQLPIWAGSFIFIVFFAPIIYAGTWVVGRINVFLMLGLALSYVTFVILGYPYIQGELLLHHNWAFSVNALPIAFTSFAYQGIIPSLTTYMNYDAKRIRIAILVGSLLPLVAYIIWEGLILGIVPTFGPGGLAEALENGDNAVYPLKNFIKNPTIYLAGHYFAFFALVTSFLGVTVGLLDFLADGLKIEKTGKGKIFLCLLIFIPPLIFSFTHPHVFLSALNYAGGFGCALLLGLLPILMVWIGRYQLRLQSPNLLPGGRLTLLLLLMFVLFELITEVIHVFKS